MIRRRRTGWWSLLLLALVALAATGALAAALKYEPAFYTAAEAEPDRLTVSSQSSRLVSRVQDLINDAHAKPEWGATFTANELNCFLDDFDADVRTRFGQSFHNARVCLAGDQLRLGLRWGEGRLSTILWLDLACWLVQSEPNCLAVRIDTIRAGLLPISSQSILDRVTEAAREANVDVTWYRHDGKPTGLFRFFSDQVRRTPRQLRTFRLSDGQMTIAGRTSVDGPQAVPAGAIPIGE